MKSNKIIQPTANKCSTFFILSLVARRLMIGVMSEK